MKFFTKNEYKQFEKQIDHLVDDSFSVSKKHFEGFIEKLKVSKHALLIETIKTMELDEFESIKAFLIREISSHKAVAVTLPFFVSILALLIALLVAFDTHAIYLVPFGIGILLILKILLNMERQRYRILSRLEYLYEMFNQHGPK